MIGIILPTRGYTFSEVDAAIEKARHEIWVPFKIFRSSGIRLPEAQNILVKNALSDPEISHLWFIEEDTVPPDGCFRSLFNVVEGISFIDYGVNGWSCSARTRNDEIVWCGMGCTLVKRYVFDKVGDPWFRSDKQFRLNDGVWVDINSDRAYGGQDIWFCLNAKQKGVRIKQIPGECRHLGIESLGKPGVNNGAHVVREKTRIEKLQIIDFPKGGEIHEHNYGWTEL